MFITVSSNRSDRGGLIFNVCELYYYDKDEPLVSVVMYLGTLSEHLIESVRDGKTNPMQVWCIAEKIMKSDFTDHDKRDLISQLAQHLPTITDYELARYQLKALHDPGGIKLKWDDWILQAMKWM